MKVSVLIPSVNRPELLCQALAAVFETLRGISAEMPCSLPDTAPEGIGT